MNILLIPFHDWRKILLEGFRTRDAHFIEEFTKSKSHKIIIVNRPTTFLEIILKRKRNLIKGKVVLSKSSFKLYEIKPNVYVIDFVSLNVFSQIYHSYIWFINQYGNDNYIEFINDALDYLGIKDDYHLLNQNIFAYKLSEKLKPKKSVFDCWDNFEKFNVYKKYLPNIELGYKTYAKVADFWMTNSKDNIGYFNEKYKLDQIFLVNNGVDLERFVHAECVEFPEDMKGLKRPIIGFGGKISQLIDTELLNKTMKLSNEGSFVFVGQILDKEVFDKIDKLDNFFYLGDKHYDQYPNYVNNFDICIVPYVIENEKKSGANTIKVYEYLATGKKVIGTPSNGIEDLAKNVYIVNNASDFVSEIKDITNNKESIDLNFHSWGYKLKQLLKIFDSTNES
ncbi:glycosyltransferase [Winogradskyella wichelsiae]|uniref:glycosyltransferase n=1 Tax=Winogradskyella wichelsiae TaxID=2697007 RepID=UPI0015C6F3E3|nr:glycosyltransferase [Winogradskyella wichelsiae]